MHHIRHIFVEARVDCHVFGPNSKPFRMLILRLNIDNEGHDLPELSHHLLKKPYCKMYPLHHYRFIPSCVVVDYLTQLFLHNGSLLFISFEASERLAELPTVLGDMFVTLVSTAE